jgi:starch synthase
MHIAHIAAEMAPLIKVGGLGDVVGALPRAQAALGHDVTVVIPAYAKVLRERELFAPPSRSVSYRLAGVEILGGVHELQLHGVRVLLIEHNDFFGEGSVYDPPATCGHDNGLRFGWFAAAALEALGEMAPTPDIVVAHDWPAALAPVLLRARQPVSPEHFDAASAIVIHNLAHQGVFPVELARTLGIDELFLDEGGLLRAGRLNLLQGAIRCATKVITVSPTYAKEIVWPSYGEGLQDELLARGNDLIGILNGIDTEVWEPRHDPYLPQTFDAAAPAGKAACKAALQAELGFRVDPALPLFAAVSRLDRQKGLDLLAQAAPWLIEQNAQLVVQGSGDRSLIEGIVGLTKHWRQSVTVIDRFDEAMAHRIYAGADFFVMPSRFEPCGLGQLIALRYGTLPIVRRTGGLADTVLDLAEHASEGTGFIFEVADAQGLQWACGRALHLFFHQQAQLDEVRQRAMRADFSWGRSAAVYDLVFQQAVRREQRRVLWL